MSLEMNKIYIIQYFINMYLHSPAVPSVRKNVFPYFLKNFN